MTHPYKELDQSAFWRTAVAEPGADGLSGLWSPKFQITPEDSIATAGSCFAQHIGKALSAQGYGWTDYEPAPPFLLNANAREFGYGVFSFRTGNIYTPKMLVQWVGQALGKTVLPDEIWEHNGRYFDPLRPAIEPNGFSSEQELLDARNVTLSAIRKAVTEADLFVFTLGLTECWRNRETDLEYALCPGTVAGRFDPDKHAFLNTGYKATYALLRKAIRMMRTANPDLRFLLTVSPVPLTATATGRHVLPATQFSKSILRAVAGQIADDLPFVDYFPSFEIITHPIFQGRFFAENARSVKPEGVATVMRHFFEGQNSLDSVAPARAKLAPRTETEIETGENDVLCEEELLDAFSS
ncbi:GSCFA domain-containing protein [Primorskyibacter sp. S87]|uniref:GSCFA domain-containing protein n=1 Tax=Primorskyibacter sp. S87 TaxID=3415126 RepID=UPI003C7BB2EA